MRLDNIKIGSNQRLLKFRTLNIVSIKKEDNILECIVCGTTFEKWNFSQSPKFKKQCKNCLHRKTVRKYSSVIN
ncbi:hypothetical protein LCGC14_0800670 [marine sediment metagenome]|uniref:Uncharacterized protein n=1 Tax=marine sediment metagenome TaxID=412755 RepID=A0A0F9SWV0_9ZZZZ